VPDAVCAKIKNPVQYAKRRAFFARTEKKDNDEKGKDGKSGARLTEEQKEMRKKYREKMKSEKEGKEQAQEDTSN
jgi:hypothetical protein